MLNETIPSTTYVFWKKKVFFFFLQAKKSKRRQHCCCVQKVEKWLLKQTSSEILIRSAAPPFLMTRPHRSTPPRLPLPWPRSSASAWSSTGSAHWRGSWLVSSSRKVRGDLASSAGEIKRRVNNHSRLTLSHPGRTFGLGCWLVHVCWRSRRCPQQAWSSGWGDGRFGVEQQHQQHAADFCCPTQRLWTHRTSKRL